MYKKGQVTEAQELRVTKLATICLGIVAILLGIAFEQMNVAFMAALAFGVAASANFPVLILSMYWRDLTTRGAMAGGWWFADLGYPCGAFQVSVGGCLALLKPSSLIRNRLCFHAQWLLVWPILCR